LTAVVLKRESFAAVHRHLTCEQTILPMSRQGFYKYCARHHLFAQAELSLADTIADADQILAFLAANGPQSRTTLSRLFGRHVPRHRRKRGLTYGRRIDEALAYLQGQQLITTIVRQHPQGGRPSTGYSLKVRNNYPQISE
jgi:hypothetical protein